MKPRRKKNESRLDLDRDTYLDEECLIWRWAKFLDGYGCLWNGYKHIKAHRYSYETYVGYIPDDMQIHHICFNKSCINPDHLELVTNTENQHKPDVTDLNWPVVLSIRRLYATGKFTQTQLGEIHGITQARISKIVNNKTWKT